MSEPVFIGLPNLSLNGVSVFAVNLARGLRALGWDARLLVTNSRPDLKPLPQSPDVPIWQCESDPGSTWSGRWKRIISMLEEHAPCVYIPNHDYSYSCISAALSPGVTVIGVAHSDDSEHYEHIGRLGEYFNVTVGVDDYISDTIRKRFPCLADRVTTIAYGVSAPEEPRKSASHERCESSTPAGWSKGRSAYTTSP